MSVPSETSNIRPLGDNNEIIRLSALLNAAKISPLVSERTLGLKDTNEVDAKFSAAQAKQNGNQHDTENIENIITNNANKSHPTPNRTFSVLKQTPPRFRNDSWRQVKLDTTDEDDGDTSLNRTPISPFHLNDCKAISFRIARNNAEKQRRAEVQLNVNRRVMDIDNELESRLRQIRIETAEEAQKRLHEKRQQRENALLDAIKQMDESARHEEETNKRELAAMIEHNRKIMDRANKIKREEEKRELFDSLKATKQVFMARFEDYVKAVTMGQLSLQAAGHWNAFVDKQNMFLKRYEDICKAVNNNSAGISAADVETFEKLCDDIKRESGKAEENIAAHKAATAATAVAAAKAAQQQAQEKREKADAAAAAAKAAAAQSVATPVVPATPAIPAIPATHEPCDHVACI